MVLYGRFRGISGGFNSFQRVPQGFQCVPDTSVGFKWFKTDLHESQKAQGGINGAQRFPVLRRLPWNFPEGSNHGFSRCVSQEISGWSRKLLGV